jgi:hypothetical protein
MPQIKFKFKKGGKVTTEVNGVKGEGCHNLASPYYEKMLGFSTSDVPTDEAYEAEPDREQEHEQQ